MAAAILLFCFQGTGRKLSTECRPVVGSRTSWRPIAGRAPKRSGDLVQRGRKNRVLRVSVHQVRAGRASKRSGDLVQRGRKNKALRGSVHQVRAGRTPKRSGDLVQRGRKNKALRGSVHQVRAGRAPKRSGDLVQRERKNKGLRGFVHQPRAEKTGKGGPGTAQVGAPLPAKPCISVTRRQHFALRRLCPSAKLAPHCRQSLMPPLRGANILPWSAAGHRPSWRLGAGKALCLRYGAPTFCPENRPGIAHVGARLPAKPYASVTGRQHFTLRIGRASPCWRPFAGKTLCLRYGAPTFYPEARPGIAHVGALLPAKPCASVTGRQHFTLRLGRQPAKFALGFPQSQ